MRYTGHQKKINFKNENIILFYIGYLTSEFLSDHEFDIFGYTTATKNKIIVILYQKTNLENYNENVLK